ncbi:hypothetical protein DFR49_0717 [Hephaestia caeni]|uniref:Uncharacterized protein n=1 Tax=Hephaestia caeni TaxID=645617 RepID=A0A397PJ60_9SPHN|nr:hypothetical protein [Hephaestia caeni]RIA46184.1 hypothetical protein DFR49_0717 [Hephaestia caeni]
MPEHAVDVKAFITVFVDADNAVQARKRAESFVQWLSPTIEQINDYNSDHDAVGTETGPFAIDGESAVEEIDE